MSELPSGWAVEPLVDLLQSLRDGTHTPPKRIPQGVPLLSARNIQNGNIDLSEAYSFISEGDYFAIQRTNPISEGDILLTIVGSIGRSCVSRTSDRFTVQRSVAIARPYTNVVNADYLSLLFRAPQFQATLENLASGTAQRGVYLGTLKAIPIPLAPLNEQSRIVVKLEKLLSRVDVAQTRLATIPRIVKRFRQSVLDAACSGQLTADWRAESPNGEPASALLERIGKQRRTSLRFGDAEADSNPNDLPESWLAVKIEELTDIQNGRAFPSKQYGQDGVRLLRPGNLHINGQVEWNDKNTACLPKQWSEDYPEFLLGAGELLMNLTAQSLKDEFLGRVCIKTDGVPALLNQRIARFVSHGTDDLRPYLFIYFKSPQFRSYVNTLDTGSLIRHMHSKQVLSHVAPLPPLAEQHEIVRRVEALFKTADALEARYLKAKAHVDKLTQSILAKAFRGELIPQDPKDEPAAVLLERIRQSKDGASVKKRGARR